MLAKAMAPRHSLLLACSEAPPHGKCELVLALMANANEPAVVAWTKKASKGIVVSMIMTALVRRGTHNAFGSIMTNAWFDYDQCFCTHNGSWAISNSNFERTVNTKQAWTKISSSRRLLSKLDFTSGRLVSHCSTSFALPHVKNSPKRFSVSLQPLFIEFPLKETSVTSDPFKVICHGGYGNHRKANKKQQLPAFLVEARDANSDPILAMTKILEFGNNDQPHTDSIAIYHLSVYWYRSAIVFGRTYLQPLFFPWPHESRTVGHIRRSRASGTLSLEARIVLCSSNDGKQQLTPATIYRIPRC